MKKAIDALKVVFLLAVIAGCCGAKSHTKHQYHEYHFNNRHDWGIAEAYARHRSAVPAIPEPASALLFAAGLGVFGLYFYGRKRS